MQALLISRDSVFDWSKISFRCDTEYTHTHTVVIKIDNKILLKTKNRVFRTLDCIPLCFVSFDIRNSFGSVIDKNKTEHISNYNDARPPILSLWSNLIAQNPILKQRVHKLKQKRKRVHNNNELEKSKLLTETRTEGNKREREKEKQIHQTKYFRF